MKRVLFFTLPALVLTACGGGDHAGPAAERAEPAPVAVRTETAASSALSDDIALVGAVAARTEVTVSARTMGVIGAVHVREGDRVRAGQTLAEIDSREAAAALDSTRAARTEAESAIAAATQAAAAAEAQRDLAASTHRRFEQLQGKKSVAPQEYDESAARLRSAEAGVAAAQAQRAQAEAGRAQADAAIAQAELALGYAKVSAPIAGVVTARRVDPGALASPGLPLLEIEPTDGYRLEIGVPESHVSQLRVGQELPVRIEALGDASPSSARVVEIVPAVDPGSRTFTAKLALPPNPALRSGLFGRAMLPGGERQALTVPASAVVARGQLRSVFVVEDGRARRRLVTAGETRAGRVEILSGLEPGDTFVADPAGVADGAPVRAGGR